MENLAAMIMNFDDENIEEYEETLNALKDMGAYLYVQKKVDLGLKNSYS